MGRTIGMVELLNIIKKRWLIILLMGVLGCGAASAFTIYLINPQYTATTQLLVSRDYIEDQTVELGDIQTNIQLINTYRDIIKDSVVVDAVLKKVGGSLSETELSQKIEIVIQSDSQIFGIKITDTSPERAAEIADSVALTFQENIDNIINVDNVAILSPAKINHSPVSPNLLFNQVIGCFVGILLGMILALMFAFLDKRMYDEDSVLEELNWASLGSITEMTKKERLQQVEPIAVEKKKKGKRKKKVQNKKNQQKEELIHV